MGLQKYCQAEGRAAAVQMSAWENRFATYLQTPATFFTAKPTTQTLLLSIIFNQKMDNLHQSPIF